MWSKNNIFQNLAQLLNANDPNLKSLTIALQNEERLLTFLTCNPKMAFAIQPYGWVGLVVKYAISNFSLYCTND
jgi:hypothetical protein